MGPLVDTSVLIDYFNGVASRQPAGMFSMASVLKTTRVDGDVVSSTY